MRNGEKRWETVRNGEKRWETWSGLVWSWEHDIYWHQCSKSIYIGINAHVTIVTDGRKVKIGLFWNRIRNIYFHKCTFQTLCPKATQKPSNLQSSPKCWHDISNINIYIQLTYTPQMVGSIYPIQNTILSQKAGCHKSWMSQKAGCHKKLVVTKAGCHKSWLSQKAGCLESWLSGSWTSESWLSGSWLSVCR